MLHTVSPAKAGVHLTVSTREVSPSDRTREQMKEWRRSWKIELIGESNPTWRDLYEDLAG
jgi:predicted GIY-YIG superfamily endonuclease